MADIHGIDRNNEADWNHNSYSDLSSSDEDLDEVGQGQSSGKMRGAPKRSVVVLAFTIGWAFNVYVSPSSCSCRGFSLLLFVYLIFPTFFDPLFTRSLAWLCGATTLMP